MKYSKNERYYVGIITNFVTVCNCSCANICNNCNDACKTYVVLKKCSFKEGFDCSLIKSLVPNNYKVEISENVKDLVEIRNLMFTLFKVNIDNSNMYLSEPSNFAERE